MEGLEARIETALGSSKFEPITKIQSIHGGKTSTKLLESSFISDLTLLGLVISNEPLSVIEFLFNLFTNNIKDKFKKDWRNTNEIKSILPSSEKSFSGVLVSLMGELKCLKPDDWGVPISTILR